ncbi:MAG: hypothetical protein C0594_07655, partial [Marinilabiliales bacterium]
MQIKTNLKYSTLLFLISVSVSVFAGTVQEKLNWNQVETIVINGGEIKTLSFCNSTLDDKWGLLPVFSKRFDIPANGLTYEFELSKPKFEVMNVSGISEIADVELIGQNVEFTSNVITIRGKKIMAF